MTYQILNGDAILSQFPDLKGEKIICRECMIDGPVKGDDLSIFLSQRASFISQHFNVTEEDYNNKCKKEISKINDISQDDEIVLWFEDDLFCQTNLWFIISLLESKANYNLSLARPNHDDWSGFGSMSTSDLRWVYTHRVRLSKESITSFSNLWRAYQIEDLKQMEKLSLKLNYIIPRLAEVVNAHAARKRGIEEDGRPMQTLMRIRKEGIKGFGDVFKNFSKEEGIYGFGDLQVKKMWERLK